MKTLLIIDVQNSYRGDEMDKKLPRIVKLAKEAMQKGWKIIVLNYNGSGKTIHRLNVEITNYKKLTRLYKNDCDGGNVVSNYMRRHRLSTNDIVVCGCYADDCVYKTVRTMVHLLDKAKISVVRKATVPAWRFPKYPKQVEIL